MTREFSANPDDDFESADEQIIRCLRERVTRLRCVAIVLESRLQAAGLSSLVDQGVVQWPETQS